MATFTVTTGDDVSRADDNVLSLREAVERARVSEGADTIVFAQGLEALRLDTALTFEGDASGLTIDGGANRQFAIETAFDATSAGGSALVFNGALVEMKNLEFFGFMSDVGRTGDTLDGKDAIAFIDSLSTTLSLTNVLFRDMQFTAVDGNTGADGADIVVGTGPRTFDMNTRIGKPGGNGEVGGAGGDAYLISLRDGTIDLVNVEIDETVRMLGGAGGVGGQGGDGGKGSSATFEDSGFFLNPFPNEEWSDGYQGGFGGTGGVGGVGGNAYILKVQGASLLRDIVVADQSQKLIADVALGGRGGAGGPGGDGHDAFALDLTPDTADGPPGDAGVNAFEGAPGETGFASTSGALFTPQGINTASVSMRIADTEVVEGEDIVIEFERTGLPDALMIKYEIIPSYVNSVGDGTDISAADLVPGPFDQPQGTFHRVAYLDAGVNSTTAIIGTLDDIVVDASVERMAIRVEGISPIKSGTGLAIAPNRDFEFVRVLESIGSFALQSDNVSLPEGEDGNISVERTGATGAYDIDYVITRGAGVDDSDLAQGDALTGTVSFLAGTGGSLQIRLDALLDNVAEGDETFTVRLDRATNRDPGSEQASLDTASTVTVTLTDEIADASVNLIAADTEVQEGEAIRFQMQRTGSTDVNINVAYQLFARADAPGFDESDLLGGFQSMPFLTDTAIFTAGGPNIIDIVIETEDDDIAEAREAFDIRILSAIDLGSEGFADGGIENPFPTELKVVIAGIDEISGAIEASDQPVNLSVAGVVTQADESVPIVFEVFREAGDGLDEAAALNTAFDVQYTIVPGAGFSEQNLAPGESLTGTIAFERNGGASQIVSVATAPGMLPDGIGAYTIVLGEATQAGSGDALNVLTTQVSGQINASNITGGAAEERTALLYGTPEADPVDLLMGTAGIDLIDGLQGDDTMRGDGGDDVLIGGEGEDTAVYSGAQSNYVLTLLPDATVLTDRRPDGNGTDRLNGIEFLDFEIASPAFGGQPMHLDIFDGAAQLDADAFAEITELYIAYFNRAPDALGLFYWATEFVEGFALPQMAKSFFVQDETQATYASVLGDTGELDLASLDKVTAFAREVYQNVLGREPDADGLAYWVDELQNNSDITAPIFLLAIINGAKFPSELTSQSLIDQQYLATKTDVGGYFAAFKGLSNVGYATTVMDLYDGSDESVQAAVDQTDAFSSTAAPEFVFALGGTLGASFDVFG